MIDDRYHGLTERQRDSFLKQMAFAYYFLIFL
jgi:hypothetical protein